MKDLSLYILDIAQNSLAAGASRLSITLDEGAAWTVFTVEDDGCGMDAALLAAVTDPFTTTRATRPVGLGLPLLKEAAELTGGGLALESAPGAGTRVTARFGAGHIDCPPLGDMGDSLSLLIQGAPELELAYLHRREGRALRFDTNQMRRALGEGVSLAEPEVVLWCRDYLREQELLIAGHGDVRAEEDRG